MNLPGVRARRHALLLDRIAEERARKGRRDHGVQRVKTSRTTVVREDDDAAPGSPARIVRIAANFDVGGYYGRTGPDVYSPYTQIDRIVHVSGPILVAESFGADDLAPDGSIVIERITSNGEPVE